MAKKKKNTKIDDESIEGAEQEASKTPVNLEDSLTPEERKKYRRAVRALRRSEWLDEYWIITILSLVVLALMIVLTIGKAVQDKRQEQEEAEEGRTPVEEENDDEEVDTYNIKEQMSLYL